MIIQHAQSIPGATGTTGTTGNSSTGSTGATGSTGSAGAASGSNSASSVSLGGANFLTLMLAQLKNQDPTSPVDSNQFLNELAQLSEVQGIQQLNSSFTSLQNSLVSSQALQASSLLGHQAMVASSTGTLASAGGTISGAVGVPQTTSDVVLNISNSSGVLLGSIDLGPQSAGLANFSWNGKLADGTAAPAGTYTLSAQVAGVSGGTAVPTYVNGTIESVTMGGSSSGTSSGSSSSGLTLNVSGIGSVPFASVQQILN